MPDLLLDVSSGVVLGAIVLLVCSALKYVERNG